MIKLIEWLTIHMFYIVATMIFASVFVRSFAQDINTSTTSNVSNNMTLNNPTITGTLSGNNTIPYSAMQKVPGNVLAGNNTGLLANITSFAVVSCSTSGSALNWTTNAGPGCNTAIDAATLGGSTFASPPAIGSGTPSSSTFTQITSTATTGTAPLVVSSTTNVANLNASSLSGATFASPGAIGVTTPGSGSFTTVSGSGSGTFGTGSTNNIVVAGSSTNPTITASGGSISLANNTLVSGTLGSSGTATFGTGSTNSVSLAGSSTNPTINTSGGDLAITPNVAIAGTLKVGGSSVTPTLSGTTGSIGGGLLTAGSCASGTVNITSAATNMVALADPNTYPGDGIIWDAQVTSAGVATVKVCAIVALTPSASTYNVRVLQ